MCNYVSSCYDNFNDFFENDRTSAELLCKLLNRNVDELLNRPSQICKSIAWEDNEFDVYPSLKSFALEYLAYGVTYSSLNAYFGIEQLPDVEDFIDADAYGRKLLEEIGKQNALLLPNGKVITTSFGW